MRDLQSNINDRGEIQNIIFKLESIKTAINLKEESEALTPEDRSRLSQAKYDISEAISKVNRIEKTLRAKDDLFCVKIPTDNGPDENGATYIGYIYAETIFEAYEKIEIIGDETRDFTKIRGENEASFYAGSIYCKLFKFAGIHSQLLERFDDLDEVAFNETQAYDDYRKGYKEAKKKVSDAMSDQVKDN